MHLRSLTRAGLAALAVAWPMPSGAESAAHGGAVRGLAIDPDGTRALTASFDYSLALWSLEREEVLSRLIGHEAAVTDVAFLPAQTRAVSVGDDGALIVWDLQRGEPLHQVDAHPAKIAAVAVAPDGARLATAGWDRTVRLWDVGSLDEVRTLTAPANLTSVAFMGEEGRIVAGDAEGALHVWTLTDGRLAQTLEDHDFAIADLALDRHRAATASIDETLKLWDLEQGEVELTLFGHEGPVLAVALSRSGGLVASGGMDGTVRVWRPGDGDQLRVYDRHAGPVWTVAFTPDGETVVSGGADGLMLTHDLDRPPGALEPARPAIDLATLDGLDDGSRGAEAFRKCAACHTVTPDGGNRAGPTLHRLFGREVGAVEGYPYSEALRESDLVWSAATIDRLFAIGPDALLPGTKMPLQRMPDPADRAALIDFLKRVTEP